PFNSFRYQKLVQGNLLGRDRTEVEILVTGAFDENRYFHCFIEYAKAGHEDILMRVTVCNRGPEVAEIHVLPHIWYRNYWEHETRYSRPDLTSEPDNIIVAASSRNRSEERRVGKECSSW